MLPRHERRLLEEIENRLTADDPELARRLAEAKPRRWLPLWMSSRVGVGFFAASMSVLCLFLGEGAGFFTSAALATVLIGFRRWRVSCD